MPGQAHSPFAVTLSPAKQTLAAGETHAVKLVKVGNSGASPIKVTSRELTLHQGTGGCGIGQTDGWLSFKPATFSLEPGQFKTVHITVAAPAGAPTTDLLAVFTATGAASAAHTSGGSVSGAVASQLVVKGNGKGATPHCGHQPKAVAASSSGGIMSFGALVGLLVLACVVLLTAAIVMGRRARRPGRSRHA